MVDICVSDTSHGGGRETQHDTGGDRGKFREKCGKYEL
jgi:hypothetical protein